jgi:hypothetical protein
LSEDSTNASKRMQHAFGSIGNATARTLVVVSDFDGSVFDSLPQ